MESKRLAIRSLNEARRLDPLCYLSLRLTVGTNVGTRDEWARSIAPKIVMSRGESTFVESLQYKETDESGKHEFRTVRHCGGSQQLAEAALIEACFCAGGPFLPSQSVYSYHPPKRYSTDGNYYPYFKLYSKRQDDIGKRCNKFRQHCVIYLDIKHFYPSIKIKRLRSCWKKACRNSQIASHWEELGNYLIDLQYAHGDGILIGSQFSHMLGNLYLADLDREMQKLFPSRYFRYVDDFAFVVKFEEKDALVKLIREKLKPLGLRLNEEKTHVMPALKWRESAPYQVPDYAEDYLGDKEWMNFIDRLKRYLLVNPEDSSHVRRALAEEGMRIPVPRYESSVREKRYQASFQRRRSRIQFEKDTASITIGEIVRHGLALRERYLTDFGKQWPDFQNSSDLPRKWKRSAIRYLIGRSILLAPIDALQSLHSAVSSEYELAEYSAMLSTILTHDVDPLLRFGWKPSVAAAPALSAAGINLRSNRKRWTQETIESAVVLKLAGCKLDLQMSQNAKQSSRHKVAVGDHGPTEWVREKEPFYRELMALTNGKSLGDFIQLIQTPFDPDENWAAFAEELMGVRPS